jgi:hypothetical protein
MVERFREKLTTEKLKDRLDRMLKAMEKEAVRVEEADAIVVRRTPARRRAR